MSDTKKKEEAGQEVPVAVDESQQLVGAEVQPQVSSAPIPVEQVSNHVENGKVEVKPPASDKNVEPEPEPEPQVTSESIPQQEVRNSLHSVPVEANAEILVKADSELTSEVKPEVDKIANTNSGAENNDAVICESNMNAAETAVQVKPESHEVPDHKTFNNSDPISTNHIEPTTPMVVPTDTKTQIESGVETDNKVNEKQVATPAGNGNSSSKRSCFLDPDHIYDGNESGTEEEQSAFMKELENFFRERSMEFKPPKFYGEGLNCLK